MVLFLLTTNEYKSLHSDILIEPIEFSFIDNILTKLYNTTYEKILITADFISSVGATKVINAFKALTTMSYRFSSNIILLNNTDVVTQHIIDLDAIGLKVINLKVKDLTYTEYAEIEKLPRVSFDNKQKQLDLDNELIGEVKESIKEGSLKDYCSIHYNRISNYLLKLDQTLKTKEGLEDDVKSLNNEIHQLQVALNYYKDKYTLEHYLNTELKHNISEMDKFISRYSSSIREFNHSLTKTNTNEEYTYVSNRETLIIYFKEYEDIGFFRVYETLFDILLTTYDLNVKSIVLERSNRQYFNPYKDYFMIQDNTVTLSNVVNYDKLVRYGNGRKIVDILTRPQMQLDVLLIYDRTMNIDLCAQLPNQYLFYLGNKRENIVVNGLEYDSFISPIEGKYKDIAYLYKDTTELTDISMKIYCAQNYFIAGLVDLCMDYKKKMG